MCVCLCVGVRSHTAVSYYVPGPREPWTHAVEVVVVSLRDAAEVPGDEGNVSWATQLLFGEANEVGFKAQTGTATRVTRQKQVGAGKATG